MNVQKFILIIFFGLFFLNFNLAGARAQNIDTDLILENQVTQDKMETRVSMDLDNTPLKEALKMLSVQSGLNFISTEDVGSRKITLFLEDVILKDALEKIFKTNNLNYELSGESNIFVVKDLGLPEAEKETKVYFLKYASATNSRTASGIGNLKEAVANALSKNGKIVEDASTNSMIITDAPGRFALIEELIAKLDVPVPQVMIEVEILDVDKSDVDTLGLKFSGENWLTYTGPNMGGTYLPFVSDTFRKAAAKTAPTPASWSMAGATIALDFLSTRTTTKFLARPKIFVLNNETAELKLSADEAVGKITTQATTTTAATESAERAETGVILKVTPQISMATGEITMVLEPSVKETVASAITIGTQAVRDIEERSLRSTVRVKDSETIILGGLIRKKDTLTLTNVPFFSKVPILGVFFRHKNHSPQKDREILVFITPRIMKNRAEISAGKINLPRADLPAREQEQFIDPKRREFIYKALTAYEAK